MQPASSTSQPIVIIGGFLTSAGPYREMRETLSALTGQPVLNARTRLFHWLQAVGPKGWALVLDSLDAAVRTAAAGSQTGKITLIGHSSGGVMARLYLGDKPFQGRTYAGLERVSLLVTLGSPHYNLDLREGRRRRWVDEQMPGAAFSPQVRYVSVAGKSWRGNRTGRIKERWAHRSYLGLSGDGSVWGDGLVPVSSALLHGSQQLTLEGVSHFKWMGTLWYGSPEAVRQWWRACLNG